MRDLQIGGVQDDCGLIPAHIKEFGKQLTELARKHAIGRYSITVEHNFSSDEDTHPDVCIAWNQGRHGANNQINYCMTVKHYIKEQHDFMQKEG